MDFVSFVAFILIGIVAYLTILQLHKTLQFVIFSYSNGHVGLFLPQILGFNISKPQHVILWPHPNVATITVIEKYRAFRKFFFKVSNISPLFPYIKIMANDIIPM